MMFRTFDIVGAKISISALCTLNCKYCYIPKAKSLKKIHNETISRLYEDIALLKSKGFTNLCLWGVEPGLTIDTTAEILRKVGWKLERIYTSTNMTVTPDKYLKAFEIFNDIVSNEVRVQISLDGDEWLNSLTRGPGVTTRIVSNLKQIINCLNKVSLNYKLNFVFKSTFDSTVIEFLANNTNKILEWYLWWDKLISDLQSLNKNENVEIKHPVTYSLAIPGKYTRKDGKNYEKVVDEVIRIGRIPGHVHTFIKLLRTYDKVLDILMTGKMSCSAGRSDIAYDRGLYHICHRTYYFENDEYISECINRGYTDWWTSKFTKEVADAVNEKLIADNDNEIIRLLYISKGYHECLSNRFSILYATIKTLAHAGLINEIYKNDEWAVRLSLFLSITHGCPMENFINCGSLHVMPASYIKLYGNGAFEKIYNWIIEVIRNDRRI